MLERKSESRTHGLVRNLIFTALISLNLEGCAHHEVDRKEHLTDLNSIAQNSTDLRERIMAIRGLAKNRWTPQAHDALVELTKSQQECARLAAVAGLAGEEFDYEDCPPKEE